MSQELKNIIEAVLLVADSPVKVKRIQGLFDEVECPEVEQIKEALTEIETDYQDRGIELRKIGSGYRFQTRDKYSTWIRKLHAVRPPRMSRALLETLAVIAYRQPVTRGDIEEVRGVSVSTEIMQKLQEREWIKSVGVREVPGRPALFGTTADFLSYFDLESLKDLPDLMAARDFSDIAGEMETPVPAEVLEALQQAGNVEAEQIGEPSDTVEAEESIEADDQNPLIDTDSADDEIASDAPDPSESQDDATAQKAG